MLKGANRSTTTAAMFTQSPERLTKDGTSGLKGGLKSSALNRQGRITGEAVIIGLSRKSESRITGCANVASRAMIDRHP